MPGALGIGVRVFVGWGPTEQVVGESADPRMRRAVIVDGPYGPGTTVEVDGGHILEITSGTHWHVLFAEGDKCISHECYLSPIDDDGELEDEDERKLEVVS